jgi:dUTPase
MVYYRLELLPTEEGREFYKEILYQANDNAGFDLYVAKDYVLQKDSTATLLDLGCRARMVRCSDTTEEECHFWLAPRSSIWKSGVTMANSMGIIDRTYRGLLMGAVLAIPSLSPYVPINKGTRLFQIVAPDMGWIKQVRIVDSLPETVRGEGGFGSTGK